MLQLGIDQITISILPSATIKALCSRSLWDDTAREYVYKISDTLNLETLFGQIYIIDKTCVQGYTNTYQFGMHPFNFGVCYHEYITSMGVVINYSAQALSFYKKAYESTFQKNIEVYDILKKLILAFPNETVHLTRIDMVADFIDEGICVDDMQKQFTAKELTVYFCRNGNYEKNPSKIRYTNKADITDTIYVGSREKNVVTLLRIYNKRLEQIQKHGTRYHEALKCTDWVRLENEIHGKYAHEVTEEICKMTNTDELSKFIATCITNKYSIAYTPDPPKHKKDKPDIRPFKTTAMLLEAKQGCDYYYSNSNYKDMSLKQSLDYLINNSGLVPFIYKIKQIDPTEIDNFYKLLSHETDIYKENRDTTKWLNEHKEHYKQVGIKDLFKFNESGNNTS